MREQRQRAFECGFLSLSLVAEVLAQTRRQTFSPRCEMKVEVRAPLFKPPASTIKPSDRETLLAVGADFVCLRPAVAYIKRTQLVATMAKNADCTRSWDGAGL